MNLVRESVKVMNKVIPWARLGKELEALDLNLDWQHVGASQ